MKAIIKDKKTRGFTFSDIDLPELKPDQVLVKVKASYICGSDLNFYLWNDWCEHVVKSLPFIPGHEGSGEIIEIGKEVKSLSIGDRVAFETHLFYG